MNQSLMGKDNIYFILLNAEKQAHKRNRTYNVVNACGSGPRFIVQSTKLWF